MTREEIIEHLDSIVGTYEILFGHGVNSDILDVDDIEAIKEAISALSENKGDLISRQAVLEGIAEWVADGYADSEADISHISSLVTHLPSVENKGEWIRTRTWEHDGELYCSKCGFAPYDERDCDNFCPNCGADMRINRKNCEYRHENGNCLKVGGFCTAVDDEHCMRGKSCNTCKNNDDELSGECYECIKGIFDHYEPKEIKTEVEHERTND